MKQRCFIILCCSTLFSAGTSPYLLSIIYACERRAQTQSKASSQRHYIVIKSHRQSLSLSEQKQAFKAYKCHDCTYKPNSYVILI